MASLLNDHEGGDVFIDLRGNAQDISTIIINGFKSAFLPHNERRELIRNVVDKLETEFSFEKLVIV